jgi:hypothetical protein
MRGVRVTIVAVESIKCYISCVCLSVALVIQHALLLLRIMLSSVACPALPVVSTLSHK